MVVVMMKWKLKNPLLPVPLGFLMHLPGLGYLSLLLPKLLPPPPRQPPLPPPSPPPRSIWNPKIATPHPASWGAPLLLRPLTPPPPPPPPPPPRSSRETGSRLRAAPRGGNTPRVRQGSALKNLSRISGAPWSSRRAWSLPPLPLLGAPGKKLGSRAPWRQASRRHPRNTPKRPLALLP